MITNAWRKVLRVADFGFLIAFTGLLLLSLYVAFKLLSERTFETTDDIRQYIWIYSFVFFNIIAGIFLVGNRLGSGRTGLWFPGVLNL